MCAAPLSSGPSSTPAFVELRVMLRCMAVLPCAESLSCGPSSPPVCMKLRLMPHCRTSFMLYSEVLSFVRR